ncbi:hypothetical protein [Catellatospora paridis]|uniref:hypothetical protein n=1 Tax=Catellatospora paridis TaxID=1617086 RepID=UPI0012D38AF8|nr:hypothetical protein [Catellatospora paridis]
MQRHLRTALATLLLVVAALFATPSSAQAACWNYGCNGYYHDQVGCNDAYRKSPILRGWLGSQTEWWLEIKYSPSCGAAFAYLHNHTEYTGNEFRTECRAQVWTQDINTGAPYGGYYTEPVETPVYNFAYTRMSADAGAYAKAYANVVCNIVDHGVSSGWVYAVDPIREN